MQERLRNTLDSLTGRTLSLAQRALTRRFEYPTVGWKDATNALGDLFDRDAERILSEPALAEVEQHVRRYLLSIEGSDPFELRWAADSVFARCCYLVCRLARPRVVIETGVAYGVSSAFILTALRENDPGRGGKLYSVDLPPTRHKAERFLGGAVPDGLRSEWKLRLGASRRVLPNVLRDTGGVDVFVHDSLHTRRNMRREFDLIWPHLRPGGLIVADDVERNGAFRELLRHNPTLWQVVKDRETHPLHGRAAPTTFGIVAT